MQMRYYTSPSFNFVKIIFSIVNLEIDLLTLKGTLNHVNEITNELSGLNSSKTVITPHPTFIC